MRAIQRTASAFLLFLALAPAACSEGAAEVRTDEIARSIREEQLDRFLARFLEQAPERAAAVADGQVERVSLSERLRAGVDFVDDPVIASVLLEFYEARGRTSFFVVDGHLSVDGEAALARLDDAWAHGLDPERYGVSALHALHEDLRSAESIATLREQLVLDAEERASLRAWLTEQTGLDETLPTDDAVFQRLLGDTQDNPVPRLRTAIASLAEARSTRSSAGPELELRLFAGLLTYAVDNRYGNFNAIPRELVRERNWNITSAESRDEILGSVLRSALGDALERGFSSWIQQLEPQHPQYPRLVAGVREYVGYVQAGGWGEVDLPTISRVGATHANIPALRRRLAAENYFRGDLTSNVFDRELRDAVLAYQATHQMNEDGQIREEVITSLNLSAERRLAQILATMDRWRNARSVREAGKEFIWVNIPEFYAEIWDQGERIHRWRVIVGRTLMQRQGNQTVIRGRTPEFSNLMRYIVFNPYWNVPQSIRRTEYDHLIAEDPNWLGDNGFEIIQTANGGELLRQVPGPRNALGQVKFLFPNEHDVYLHDTPTRRLFDRTMRSFSHGCVRVDQPMDLAHLLVKRDRGWSDAQTAAYIERMMNTGTEQWMSLQRLIPIHIEYYPVTGSDSGRIEFLADIYRYDREAWDEREEWVRSRWQPQAAAAHPADSATQQIEAVVALDEVDPADLAGP